METIDMKTSFRSLLTLSITPALMLLCPGIVQASPLDVQAKVPSRIVPNIRSVPEVPLPQSIFILPGQTGEGRNPFFPQSSMRVVIAEVTRDTPAESFSFVLNGITSPPRRTAMINGRTFEPGEEGEVRLPTGGKILIKCEEIRVESAIINVRGLRRELKLRSGL
jgi:hypothetical protein